MRSDSISSALYHRHGEFESRIVSTGTDPVFGIQLPFDCSYGNSDPVGKRTLDQPIHNSNLRFSQQRKSHLAEKKKKIS